MIRHSLLKSCSRMRHIVPTAMVLGLALVLTARADFPRTAEGLGWADFAVDAGSGWEVRQLTLISKSGTYLAYGNDSPYLSCAVNSGGGAESVSADIIYYQDIDWLAEGDPTALGYTWHVKAEGIADTLPESAGATSTICHNITDPLSQQLTISATAPADGDDLPDAVTNSNWRHNTVTPSGLEYTDTATIHVWAQTSQ